MATNYFEKGMCVLCHKKLDLPGFFCSKCGGKNQPAVKTQNAPVIVSRKVSSMQNGEEGYIQITDIVRSGIYFWIYKETDFTSKPEGNFKIKVVRSLIGIMYLDCLTFKPEDISEANDQTKPGELIYVLLMNK